MSDLNNPIEIPDKSALILVDVQKGFDLPIRGRRNNPQAEANMVRLLSSWRRSSRPIFHIQHLSLESGSPLEMGTEGSAIKPEVRPLGDEPILQKHVNSAFIGTNLEVRLLSQGISAVVIVGLTTNHCVETTTRMAGNLGFQTYLVSDATATFDRAGPDGIMHRAEDIHAMSLLNLHQEFATIVTTDEVLGVSSTPHPDQIA